MRNKDDTADLRATSFNVDAALIRELGETLIGRAHIALGELVKNSYDADAHSCEIDISNDSIIVSDDGHGISQAEFHDFWMRLGTKHKVKQGRSRILNRSLTGSKGLGRLSVQFLADEMELESNCPDDPGRMLYALVDWTSVRSGGDLTTIEVGWEPRKETSTYADGSPTGTRIILKGLKKTWDAVSIEDLGRDVWLLRSPFRQQKGPASRKTALDFHVDIRAPEIEDVKDRFDKLKLALFNSWKARITGTLRDGRSGTRENKATFTVEFAKGYPEGVEEPQTIRETVSFPIVQQGDIPDTGEVALDSAQFTILVFKTVGRQSAGITVGELREYLKTYGDVAVYDSGFRLPYYGSRNEDGNDWLNIGADQGRRLNTSDLLPDRLRIEGRYLLDLPNPDRIIGAVDVDTNHEQKITHGSSNTDTSLQIQPGRDRLAPNKSFEQLRNLVRFGLDLYANRYRALADEFAQTQRVKEPPSRVLDTALTTLTEHESEIPREAYRTVKKELVAARQSVSSESRAIEAHAALLAPLATAGMAALAMNHELTNDADLLKNIEGALQTLSETTVSPLLSSALTQLEQYRENFEAYRFLFSPLADPEGRRAMNRLPVKTVVAQVVNALRRRLSGLSFAIDPIPSSLLFPVGAFVEWSAILQNILFNGWNATLESDVRVIRFDGSNPTAKRQFLRVSDTGVGLTMPIEETGVLFEAFERRISISPAVKSIAIGGQGLGLAIVRMIANSRKVSVAFVTPPSGFTTSIELSWRSKQ